MLETFNVLIEISRWSKHKDFTILNAVTADENMVLFIDDSNAARSIR